MTCFEKYKFDHGGKEPDLSLMCPEMSGGINIAEPDYCPQENGTPACHDCWNREVPGMEGIHYCAIKDSGERRQFSTGAVRDMAEGKGDMVSMPWEALLRLSKHYEAGAKKYARWNYCKGIPVSSFIDSACRHLAKYQCGLDDEDHLAAAAFNILGAMLMENTMPDMQDLPTREGKNTFNYFMEEK